jgi:hypothetical protein
VIRSQVKDFRRNGRFIFGPLWESAMPLPRLLIFTAFALSAAQPVESQPVRPQAAMSYADLADLALAAPIVAHVQVARAHRLSTREAPDVPAGQRRFLIEADVMTLIRGAGGLPQRVSYLVDLPDDARGRPARIARRTEYLLLATRVPNRPAELRLIAPDAQIDFSPATATQLRAILQEAAATDAPPRITGIGRAFHVEGSLPGEGETQIFLETADDRPISLNVLRRPGAQPRWSVALSEIVDDAARPPQPDTLLWYRLACSLPPTMPAASLREAAPNEATAIRNDYQVVIRGLGPCTRTRG